MLFKNCLKTVKINNNFSTDPYVYRHTPLIFVIKMTSFLLLLPWSTLSNLMLETEKLMSHLFQLEVAEAINVDGKALGSIYVSLGVTYSECKQYDKALQYYRKELNVKDAQLAEVLTSLFTYFLNP